MKALKRITKHEHECKVFVATYSLNELASAVNLRLMPRAAWRFGKPILVATCCRLPAVRPPPTLSEIFLSQNTSTMKDR